MRRAAALAALLVAATAAPAHAQTADFTDDDGHPGERALEWLAEQGVIHGCDPPDNREVCPDERVNRAQAAKILVGLARAQEVIGPRRPGQVDHFVDDDTVWKGGAEPYIDHLADLGVVHGCDPPINRSFCPHQELRRGEITKMVVRTFGLEAPSTYVSPWTDTAGQFFHEAARVAAHHRLFDASAGSFDGYRPVSRAEFASLVAAVFRPEMCDDDPFTAGRVARLQSDHPGIRFTAYAHDLDSGCAYWMNPGHRQETASVFKVMVMGGTFLEAQSQGRGLSSQERGWLEPMITRSANPPVRDLWRSFGGAPWFERQVQRFGLGQTRAVGDYRPGWGETTTSAYDQGKLLRTVLLGEDDLVADRFQEVAFDLMTQVVPSQSWGVTRGVPAGWTVAQKNGFAGATANSVGVVYDGSGKADYVIVVLTFGWPDWDQGIPAVERVASWVSESFVD